MVRDRFPYIFILLFGIGFFVCVPSIKAQTSTTFFSGTGQSVSASAGIDSMATEAVNKAKSSYEATGGTASTAKVVIIMENVNDSSTTLVNKIRSVFGSSVLVLGMQDPWAEYTPFTVENIPADSAMKSLSLMVLGGSSINVSYASGVANFTANSNTEAQKGGKDLATKLHPLAGVNNLILVMGQMHTPLNEYVIAGMKEVFGSTLPSNEKIIGWGGPYWGGNIYDNGVLKTNQIQGVMISGNFKWAFRGINHGINGWDGISGPDAGDPVAAIAKSYTQITQELGTKPLASFMVLGHPDRSLFPTIRDRIVQTVGSVAMIGQHAGSETGHDITNGDVIPDASHYFLAGIASGNTNTTPVPTLALSPTAADKLGDANRDAKVNGQDYIIWFSHYNQTITGASSVGDFNNDGKVNGQDYIIWLTHYSN